jgi:hypothetical protein
MNSNIQRGSKLRERIKVLNKMSKLGSIESQINQLSVINQYENSIINQLKSPQK